MVVEVRLLDVEPDRPLPLTAGARSRLGHFVAGLWDLGVEAERLTDEDGRRDLLHRLCDLGELAAHADVVLVSVLDVARHLQWVVDV